MFLTQIVNGEMTELALCEHCAKEKGVFDPQTLTFAEKFFPSMIQDKVNGLLRDLQSQKKHTPAAPERDALSQCPVCSFKSDDYYKTGRLGCPHCYSVFAEDFTPDLKKAIARGAGTDGARTADGGHAERLSRQELETRLKRSIEQEDYELAAQLRDQIKALS